MQPNPRRRQCTHPRPPALPEGVPEYAVDRATLMTFFRPPVSESTFYKLQQGGYIVPVEGVSGRYRLNASLSRLGLKPVAELPQDKPARTRNVRADPRTPESQRGRPRRDPAHARPLAHARPRQGPIRRTRTLRLGQLPQPPPDPRLPQTLRRARASVTRAIGSDPSDGPSCSAPGSPSVDAGRRPCNIGRMTRALLSRRLVCLPPALPPPPRDNSRARARAARARCRVQGRRRRRRGRARQSIRR